ncbi:MAG: 50S ribosomal protein L16 [Candidatus Marinimicrobia bacterium]|jgi:large subunit ribosomal protein L16|nr:50S ribosomal protein L16 [Candidatus Neomarinimicrobiota bacterium]MBT3936225.1 50S ribosomal protein L16 [Candidatus Neomarinimicrobiota bacterium]MBT4383987.1 50S ribosomal protein L16 [Candidatus Neomarinimicrobiota bacterium]MBT4635030.1 50S ribosomal protein L16 [Candidatus Neomarinimicrobiota bacterium]MBT4685624.1 50S ribosomal protein L16 [Candidatus Neomarinimicrobiota bacterium]
MLEPKKTKFRRHHRGNRRGLATRGAHVAFGAFGLKAIEPGWITARQIESSRIAISRGVRKVGKMWIRIFPDKPITAKPAETRMGKGKGSPEYWVSVVKPGRILFEVDGVTREVAEELFRNAGHKLPVKTKIVARREM